MKRFILLCVLSTFVFCLFADGSKRGLLPKDSFQFIRLKDGVKIGLDTDVRVIKKVLGKSKTGIEYIGEAKYRKYSWNGLNLYVLPGDEVILMMTITNNYFSTIGGVSIGTEKVKIIETLGEPASSHESFIRYYYSTMEETWNLVFFLDKGKVSSIQIHRID